VSPSLFRLLADTIVAAHLAFVLFVVLGGVLVLRWRRLMWLHIPSAAWGIAVEFAGWVCPLTPIENVLRERAGMAAYQGDFIEQYVVPLLYPGRLTRATQFALGGAALLVNSLVYWRLASRSARTSETRHGDC
jgi:uncharacterized protein DUF2784